MFGITNDGFVAKRLNTILTELRDEFTNTFGTTINLDDRGPFGQIIAIMADREAELWELAEGTFNNQTPSTATGVGVDNALALVGVPPRMDAFESEVMQTFFGAVGTVIPVGTQVSRNDDSTVIFETQEAGTIQAGSGQNPLYSVEFNSLPDAGAFTLTYDGQTTPNIPSGSSAAFIQSQLEGLSSIGAGNVSVSGDFSSNIAIELVNTLAETEGLGLTATSTLTNLTVPVEAVVNTQQIGSLPNVTVTSKSTVTGEIVANAGTLIDLVAGVTGVESVSNLVDATLGSDIESDQEALARRQLSLAAPGHATAQAIIADIFSIPGVQAVRVFENIDIIEDLMGRPPKSYEVVVQGGDEDEIAQIILDTKALGTETTGSINRELVDSQGFQKFVAFSRPTSIPIDLQVDLRTNTQFPINGTQLAEAALLAYGNALNIGDDVIVITQLLCSLNGIPGIIDVDIRVGANTLPAGGSQVVTFTNVGSDLSVNFVGHPFLENNRVKFSNVGGALPTGINPDTIYYVVSTSPDSFLISDGKNNGPSGFFDAGSGTTTVEFGGFDENINITESERAIFDSSRISVTSL